MSAHTPGPWSMRPSETYRCEVVGAGQVVARVPTPRRSPSVDERLAESKANAALIAAAPDLLEALEKAVRYADHDGACRGVGIGCICWKSGAGAAIAKARGES